MTDKEKRQERIKELHEKSIDELFNIAKYNDFRAAKKEENALYYAIGYLMGRGADMRGEA